MLSTQNTKPDLVHQWGTKKYKAIQHIIYPKDKISVIENAWYIMGKEEAYYIYGATQNFSVLTNI